MTNKKTHNQIVKNAITKLMRKDLFEMTDDFIGDIFYFEINEHTLEVKNVDIPASKDIKYFDFLFKKHNIEYNGTESYMDLYQFYANKVISDFLGE